jgi:hypothetical protein
MAVIWTSRDEKFDTLGGMVEADEFACFFCEEALEYPFVVWSGRMPLFLHPGCACDLIGKLQNDLKVLVLRAVDE